MRRVKNAILPLLLIICVLATPAHATSVEIWDVSPDNWAYPYAFYMAELGLMPLKDGHYFNPDKFTSRGEFILYLWRAAGSPHVWTASPTFTDVKTGDENYYAVEWAVHHNITTGTSDTEFSPHLALTRETAFTFLWRALPFFDYSTEGLTGRYINGFMDAEHVSHWAWEAMNGLCALAIVNGSDGYLLPLQNVANSETAAILYRTLELVDAIDPEVLDQYFIDFYIINESAYDIRSIHVMPAYSDGEGIDIMPFVLESGESYRVQLTEDFIYAESDVWRMRVTDSYGDVTEVYQIFNPGDLEYIVINYEGLEGEFSCVFL